MEPAGEHQKYLEFVDAKLSRLWRVGRNAVVGWRPISNGIEVLAVPQFLLANLLSNHEDILVGSAQMTKAALKSLSDVCEIEPYKIVLPQSLRCKGVSRKAVADIICRYSITKLKNKAVMLFDIVGFSRYSPLEQVTELNSLSYSINIAYRRAIEHGLPISLGHSTTGDGFYVWNRKHGSAANLSLFSLMILILIDNSLGQKKGMPRSFPKLRTCFQIGSCYEYYQADGTRPGNNSFIVGESTIELARMINKALPSQILVGNFLTSFDTSPAADADTQTYNAPQFVEYAQEGLNIFGDLNLSREKISTIDCYLTGFREDGNPHKICRYVIRDKHGFQHEVFNLKVNVLRQRGKEIHLGCKHQDLEEFPAEARTTTEFRSFVPDTDESPTERQAKDLRDSSSPTETILVVDDDPEVRVTAVKILKHLGYHVLEAVNGPAAQTVMESHPKIDLLFTDVVMPGGLNGPALASYAEARTPNTKVLFTSGYAEKEVLQQYTRDQHVEVIMKPYQIDELASRVREILDA